MISNVKKLAVHKMSVDAIPPGEGLNAGIKFLSDPKSISNGFKKAHQWVLEAIQTVRQAGEPNPFKDYTDDDIAGMILNKIEKLRKKKHEQTNSPNPTLER